MTKYSIREMRLVETRSMIRYFLKADLDYLKGMGVDPAKMPSEGDWFELLDKDYARPIEERKFYYLIWAADGDPVGHCNINKITFGDSAYMHLHIWNTGHRRTGCATRLLEPSIEHFFDRFKLERLFCEPYAKNPAPNRALPKAGFTLVKTYETMPGWITFHQPVNLWVLDREKAMSITNPVESSRE